MHKVVQGIVIGVLLIVSAATLTTGWVFSDPAYIRVGWIICAFVAGMFVLGRLLLGQRDYWDASVSQNETDRRIWILLLWAFGLAVCAIPLYPGKWQLTVAAIVGMIIGSIIWPPKPEPDTNEEALKDIPINDVSYPPDPDGDRIRQLLIEAEEADEKSVGPPGSWIRRARGY